jgi:hypothetical protein
VLGGELLQLACLEPPQALRILRRGRACIVL